MSDGYTPRLSFAPSSAGTWFTGGCTAMPKLKLEHHELMPPYSQGFSAREGDLYHAMVSRKAGKPVDCHAKPGELTKQQEHQMGCLSDEASDRITEISGNGTIADVFLEQKMRLPFAEGHCYVDLAMIALPANGVKPHAVIVDHKYGMGISVGAFENPQIAIYQYAFLHTYDLCYDMPDDMELSGQIWQPRVRAGHTISSWSQTKGELYEFMDPLLDTVSEIQDADSSDDLVFNPSVSNCRWCPCKDADGGKGVCDAYKRWKQGKAISQGGSNITENQIIKLMQERPDADTLIQDDPKLAAYFAKNKSAIVEWIGKMESSLYAGALNGEQVHGMKLVRGRQGNIAWSDPVKAEKLAKKKLKDEAYKKSLVTPTQFNDLTEGDLTKKEQKVFDAITNRSPGKLTLVSEDDPRDEVMANESEGAMFDALDEEDEDDILA